MKIPFGKFRGFKEKDFLAYLIPSYTDLMSVVIQELAPNSTNAMLSGFTNSNRIQDRQVNRIQDRTAKQIILPITKNKENNLIAFTDEDIESFRHACASINRILRTKYQ